MVFSFIIIFSGIEPNTIIWTKRLLSERVTRVNATIEVGLLFERGGRDRTLRDFGHGGRVGVEVWVSPKVGVLGAIDNDWGREVVKAES